jgi:hypothetical protein
MGANGSLSTTFQNGPTAVTWNSLASCACSSPSVKRVSAR